MDSPLVNYYAREADKKDRDPYGPDGSGRATVVNGRGFQKWRRFNPGGKTVWVENIDGRMFELTHNQSMILSECLASEGGTPVTMRSLARRLRLSPSTISRAMVRLASFGLIAYLTTRGRYAETFIFRRVKGDSLERFRTAAKAKVRQWSQAAQRRLSRLEMNVASYLHEEGRGVDSLYYYLTSITSTKGATIEREWTAEDVAGVV